MKKTLLIALICIYAIYVCKSHVKPVIFRMGLGFISLYKNCKARRNYLQ